MSLAGTFNRDYTLDDMSETEKLNRRIYEEILGYHFVSPSGLKRQGAILRGLFPRDTSFQAQVDLLLS